MSRISIEIAVGPSEINLIRSLMWIEHMFYQHFRGSKEAMHFKVTRETFTGHYRFKKVFYAWYMADLLTFSQDKTDHTWQKHSAQVDDTIVMTKRSEKKTRKRANVSIRTNEKRRLPVEGRIIGINQNRDRMDWQYNQPRSLLTIAWQAYSHKELITSENEKH